MSNGKQSIRRLSTGLIAAGVVLMLVVGGYLLLTQLRGAELRRDLRQPPATAISVPVAQAWAAGGNRYACKPATVTPSPTPVEPEPTQPRATAAIAAVALHPPNRSAPSATATLATTEVQTLPPCSPAHPSAW